MANLLTVSGKVWSDDVFAACPGVAPKTFELALHNALREFCKQSGAWIVELWDLKTGDAVPFNSGADHPFYDFQARLRAARTANGPDYASGDNDTEWAAFHTIEEYWPWDILYVNSIAYFEKYTVDPNPSLQTQQATAFISPSQTPWNRTPHSSFASETGRPKLFKTFIERPGAIQLVPTLKGDTANNEGIVPMVSLGFNRDPDVSSTVDIPIIFQQVWYDHILDGTIGRLMSQQDKPWTNPVLAQYHLGRFRNGISEARDAARRQMNMSEDMWVFPAWA